MVTSHERKHPRAPNLRNHAVLSRRRHPPPVRSLLRHPVTKLRDATRGHGAPNGLHPPRHLLLESKRSLPRRSTSTCHVTFAARLRRHRPSGQIEDSWTVSMTKPFARNDNPFEAVAF